MISEETLLAVYRGIVSDSQLQEALQYYTLLEELLKDHRMANDKYELVWSDVYSRLTLLQQWYRTRLKENELLLKNRPFEGAKLKREITFDITGKSL